MEEKTMRSLLAYLRPSLRLLLLAVIAVPSVGVACIMFWAARPGFHSESALPPLSPLTPPSPTAPVSGAMKSIPPKTPAASSSRSTNYPLAGQQFYVNPGSITALNINASCSAYYPGSSGLIALLASKPQGVWFGNWDTNVEAAAAYTASQASSQGTVPIMVAYNIPIRDCGGYSSGGAPSASAYQTWITQFAQGIGRAKVVVILEPDAVSQLNLPGCLTRSEASQREGLLSYAVQQLKSLAPEASVYIDAGYGGDGLPAATIASQLDQAGVANAAGFSLNVSNYVSNGINTTYGQQISALIGGKHFVIDTSRNGLATANGVWCNPPNQGAGVLSEGFSSGTIDGYLWVQNPGVSDGACNGETSAGVFDLLQACTLAHNAVF
jgi:endoglucanase